MVKTNKMNFRLVNSKSRYANTREQVYTYDEWGDERTNYGSESGSEEIRVQRKLNDEMENFLVEWNVCVRLACECVKIGAGIVWVQQCCIA